MIADQHFSETGNGRGEELRVKRTDGTIWGDENVLYFECNSVYTKIHVWQNSLNCTFKWILLCVNSTFYIESDKGK